MNEAASALDVNLRLALFPIALSAIGFLLIGIHNAWDTVTYIVISAPGAADATKTE